MIHIVTTALHAYTHKSLREEEDAPELALRTYADISLGSKIAPGTYILTDLDRLAAWRLLDAAKFCQWHRKKGGVVLNDPARVLSRHGLLRALNRAGINQFDAYRVEEKVTPKRWPVFLRLEGNHGAQISGLLENEKGLTRAIEKVVDNGYPIAALLIVEYAAEPVQPGLFRKFSVFRVGDRLLGYTCVHDDQWIVKQGKPGIAPLEFYEEEYRCVRDTPYAEAIWPAFRIAGIDYGRVDFGIVDGRPQIYEINTNPEMKLRPPPSPVARRDESCELFRVKYLKALRALDGG